MIKEAILKLVKKQDLSFSEAKIVMDEIMEQKASIAQIASYLTALSIKGESVDEITACASSLRSHCVGLVYNKDILEIVGTGGDGSNSFNISTTACIIVSAAGIPIAKHGNRASSSKCGSADVLEELGVNIMLSKEQSQKLLQEINICFLFAQNYHIAMRHVAPIRKELGIKTIFNILGPLSNPASANMQLMGVYEESLVEPLAKVLNNLGVKYGMVVYGLDGLDEISTSNKTKICEIFNNTLKTYTISPKDFGYKIYDKRNLLGGSARDNAKIIKDILLGEERGAKRQAVCLNAGAALYIARKVPDIKSGVIMAEKIIDSKLALKKLESFIKESNKI
ncbi:anthranilate phosphoribosyltransferase [Helicobacter sp. MIT 14-3879]|uniref:anthranilate phosphoribosyltransferase n=1 Tax=Helicobacter sp. MIT 14-3879 TaxID=2040649 RepID=UPI000E1E5290|nr:anthranilate phosphoribosyltransferase [Helicobacter sp. MIT 14-3879]RDU62851.1 anthranilate phosphoribosyltransferase [Helicobacter sp. MIT 14-3879]